MIESWQIAYDGKEWACELDYTVTRLDITTWPDGQRGEPELYVEIDSVSVTDEDGEEANEHIAQTVCDLAEHKIWEALK